MIINSASGLVGIGTASPTDQLHVNSPSGTNPFRAQVNGSTKFIVNSNGGVSVGSSSAPPSNGLYVSGTVGIGTTTPTSKLQVVGGSNNGIITSGTFLGIQATATDESYGFGVSAISNYIGVSGSSGTNGTYGTAGSSGYIGAYGSGGSYGVYGTTTGSGSTGVYGEGYVGIFGYHGTNSGYGMYSTAYGENSYGSYAYSDKSIAFYAETNQSNGYGGFFVGNVYSSGNYVSSDRNLKKDITDLTSGLDIILKLKPKSYNFRQDGNYKLMNLPQGQHYGLIAQDVEQLLPGMVKASQFDARRAIPLVKLSKDPTLAKPVISQPSDNIEFKALNYTELIPILIKGMQEQEVKIQEQQKINEDLQKEISELKALMQTITAQKVTIKSSTGFLKQNTPNPANKSTVIPYYTPDETRNAQILVTDMKGSVLKSYNVSKGEGQVNIKSGELPTGMYNYTLYINSNKIETKQMIIIN